MVNFKDVSFGYRTRELFSGVSIEFDGGVCGLLGPNGAGKSTLLKLATGLLSPRSGSVEISGRNPVGRQPAMLEQIMFVPEEFDLPASTFERFTAVTAPFYPTFSHEALNDYSKVLGIKSEWYFNRMSMGERKKAYIAFALAACTPYLFMDEPTNGLDIAAKSAFRHLLAEATDPQNRTIVISTHQARDIENLLDRVVIIDEEGIRVDTTVARIEDAQGGRFDLEKFYLTHTQR